MVINIVDATNLERNLYLTLQLLQLGRPVVVALNMMDEVRSHGDVIDLAAMEKGLGVPVVAICARKGEGLDELVRRAMDAAENHRLPPKLDICTGAAHKALHAIQHLVEQPAQAHGMTSRYAATKLFEGDAPMMEELDLSEDTRHIIEEILTAMEREVGMERAAVMADTRYRFIEKLLSTCYTRATEEGGTLTDRLDRVLTHPLLAIPVFLLMMLLVFYITFGPIGTWLADGFAALVQQGVDALAAALADWGVAGWVRSLLVDGALKGVGSVLSFLPTILLLFLLLSILEDSGYMARAAFLMDKPLRKLGLNGRAFIPMMMGFGCTVPAVMSARSMNNQRDRALHHPPDPLHELRGQGAHLRALHPRVLRRASGAGDERLLPHRRCGFHRRGADSQAYRLPRRRRALHHGIARLPPARPAQRGPAAVG